MSLQMLIKDPEGFGSDEHREQVLVQTLECICGNRAALVAQVASKVHVAALTH